MSGNLMRKISEAIKFIVYLFFGFLFKNRPIKYPLNPKNIEKVLVFRYDKIGDMVVSQPSFAMLRDILPETYICVLSSPTNAFLLENFCLIDHQIVLPKSFMGKLRTILNLRKEKFDLIINFVFYRTTKAGLLANLINHKAVKVNLAHEKRYNLYSKLFNIQLHHELHGKVPMSEFLCYYIGLLFGKNFDYEYLSKYSIPVPEDFRKRAIIFRNEIPSEKVLLVNISAGKQWSVLNYIRLVELIKSKIPSLGIIFVGHPKDYKKIKTISKFSSGIFTLPEKTTIYDVIALVHIVDFVFTPDTSVVHFANVFRKPMVLLYSRTGSNINEWLPNNVEYKLLISKNLKNFDDITPEIVLQNLLEIMELRKENSSNYM
ncbi:MAG: hypothetical protein N2517_00765 [Ignavibacteria bacterium]|nr:hypothetical protein [Ignavibacteria bacterium]